jgi:hypothetical protein
MTDVLANNQQNCCDENQIEIIKSKLMIILIGVKKINKTGRNEM